MVRGEGKGMDEINEMIREQIRMLAKISKGEKATTEDVIQCSVVMADLYRALQR
jgi:hypothetical protein